MPPEREDLESWVGRTQRVEGPISAVQVRQIAAALDDAARMRDPDAQPLPAGWHWAYFNPLEVQSRLGADGHPLRGDFLPPVALPRRMWAGSRLRWERSFHVSMQVGKTSRILKVTRKAGRSGQMVFVTVGHEYADAQGVLLTEEHDIVYREAVSEAEQAELADLGARVRAGQHAFEREGRHRRAFHADATLLFRYSAATFNGHRIHYDVDYCRDVEGYPGLVVHGPLIATLLLQLIEADVAPGRFIRSFEFRALQPTFHIGGFHLHADAAADGDGYEVWSTNNIGKVGLTGRVTLA